MPRPDGNLGLASESGSALQRTIKAHLSSVQNALDPEIEAVFHLEPVRAAIGMVITFCALWFLLSSSSINSCESLCEPPYESDYNQEGSSCGSTKGRSEPFAETCMVGPASAVGAAAINWYFEV